VVRLTECDSEASKMRRPWLVRGCYAMGGGGGGRNKFKSVQILAFNAASNDGNKQNNVDLSMSPLTAVARK
jgi:hypothetical protein